MFCIFVLCLVDLSDNFFIMLDLSDLTYLFTGDVKSLISQIWKIWKKGTRSELINFLLAGSNLDSRNLVHASINDNST